jgi:hypothetical protein
MSKGEKNLEDIMSMYETGILNQKGEIDEAQKAIDQKNASIEAIQNILKKYTGFLNTTVSNYRKTLVGMLPDLLKINAEADSPAKKQKLDAFGETLKSMDPAGVWDLWLQGAEKKAYEAKLEGDAAFTTLYADLKAMAAGTYKPPKN